MTQLIERTAVRLLVLDANEDVLLLHTRDLSDASFGSAWELPGGGVEGVSYSPRLRFASCMRRLLAAHGESHRGADLASRRDLQLSR
jgi:hypothetical protein